MIFWVLLVRLLITLNLQCDAEDAEDSKSDVVVTFIDHILVVFYLVFGCLMHTMASSTQFDFRITCMLAMSLLCMKNLTCQGGLYLLNVTTKMTEG